MFHVNILSEKNWWKIKMSDDWKRDLAEKIADEVWAMETTDVLVKVIEDAIKEFAEKRLVRVHFKR